jgi:hypothetical protein
MSRLVDALAYFIRYGGMVALIFPIFAGFAICAGFGALENYRSLALLESDGVPAMGEVCALRAVDLGDMGQTDVRYFVTCRFRLGGGELVERETKVPDARRGSLRKGDAVALRYSRSGPAVWDISDGRSAAREHFRMGICFIAGAASAAIYCSLWVAEAFLKQRWLPEPVGQTVDGNGKIIDAHLGSPM